MRIDGLRVRSAPATVKTPTASPLVGENVQSSRLRRRLFVALLAGLLAVGWFSGRFGGLCLEQARASLRRGFHKSADGWLQWADRLNGDRAESALFRARLARHENRPRDISRWLEIAEQRGTVPEWLDLESILAQVQYGRLSEVESKMLALVDDGREPGEVCWAVANRYILDYRLQEAATILQRWRVLEPRAAAPDLFLGRLHEYNSNHVKAEAAYRQGLSVEPDYAPCVYNLARLLAAQQRYDEALPLYRRLEPLIEHPAPALLGQGRCLRLKGELSAARPLLVAAAAAGSAARETYRWLGDPLEAAASKANYELGLLELDEGHFEAAVRELELALEANPTDWNLRFSYATALRSVGRRDEAQAELVRVERARKETGRWDELFLRLQRNPSDAMARYEIGRIMVEHLSETQGLIWINSAADADPDLLVAREFLADFYTKKAVKEPVFAPVAVEHQRAVERLRRASPAVSPEAVQLGDRPAESGSMDSALTAEDRGVSAPPAVGDSNATDAAVPQTAEPEL